MKSIMSHKLNKSYRSDLSDKVVVILVSLFLFFANILWVKLIGIFFVGWSILTIKSITFFQDYVSIKYLLVGRKRVVGYDQISRFKITNGGYTTWPRMSINLKLPMIFFAQIYRFRSWNDVFDLVYLVHSKCPNARIYIENELIISTGEIEKFKKHYDIE